MVPECRPQEMLLFCSLNFCFLYCISLLKAVCVLPSILCTLYNGNCTDVTSFCIINIIEAHNQAPVIWKQSAEVSPKLKRNSL
jgi:hypothetical protein